MEPDSYDIVDLQKKLESERKAMAVRSSIFHVFLGVAYLLIGCFVWEQMVTPWNLLRQTAAFLIALVAWPLLRGGFDWINRLLLTRWPRCPVCRKKLTSFQPALRRCPKCHSRIVYDRIAILTSLLLPALNSARSKARAMTCLASQRSIGQYFAMYTLGYDDFWPASMDPGGRAWISQLINGGIIKRSSDAGAYAYNSGGKWVRYPGNANVCPELGIAAEQRVRCYAYPVSNNEKYPGVGGVVSDDYTSINKPMKTVRIKTPASVVALFEKLHQRLIFHVVRIGHM